ncbi:kinase [Hirsutella rhossiliensis]
MEGEHSGENMADVLLQVIKDYKITDRAFLIGKDAKKICKDLDAAYKEGDMTRIRELWRKRGAIGRLHNIIRYIRASPQRRQFFRSIACGGALSEFDGLELIQSQQTRWNSYFMSIGRALNVKERIQIFCDQYEAGQSQKSLAEDRLSEQQWNELAHLHDQLETFYDGTLSTEGRHSTLADHFQTLDWLLNEIQQAKIKFEELHRAAVRRKTSRGAAAAEADNFAFLAASAEASWRKAEQYFNKVDETPAYYTAISLNPTLKNLPAIDLLDQFLETDVIRLGEEESFDVIKYWNDRYHTQPDLARMALDVLSVPPMSDECERLFSSAKILLSDRRSRLKIDIIEASECLRSWASIPGFPALCKKLILGRAKVLVYPSGSQPSPITRHRPARLYSAEARVGNQYFPEADVEELEGYAPGGYHPTAIGDSFHHGRYIIVHKLGFGGYSTIWLARDEQLHRHVSVKIIAAHASADTNEATVLRTLQQTPASAHVGRPFIPAILDQFSFDGPNGHHLCLVTEPAGCNVAQSKEDSIDFMFPAETARSIAARCVMGLSYLHSNGVCHGDLHMRNILLHDSELSTTSTTDIYKRFGEPYSVPIRRLDGGALELNAPPHAIFPMAQNMRGHEMHDPEILISEYGTSFLVKQASSPTLYTPEPMVVPAFPTLAASLRPCFGPCFSGCGKWAAERRPKHANGMWPVESSVRYTIFAGDANVRTFREAGSG